MLPCLLTYADIKAVNPEALTPWKAENVWQLYMGAENYLNRSADHRVHADVNDEKLARLRSLAPVTSSKFKEFLEGFPQSVSAGSFRGRSDAPHGDGRRVGRPAGAG